MLTVGGHDHLAGAVGAGAAENGDVLDSCGTAEAFVQATAPLRPEAVGSAVRSGLSVGWHADRRPAGRDRRRDVGIGAGAVLGLLGVDPAERDALEAAALEIERRHRGPTLSVTGLGEDALSLGGIGRRRVAGGGVPRRARCRGRRRRGRPRAHGAVAGPARRLLVTGGWAAGDAARAVKQRHLGECALPPADVHGRRGAALAAGRAAGVWKSADDMAA